MKLNKNKKAKVVVGMWNMVKPFNEKTIKSANHIRPYQRQMH